MLIILAPRSLDLDALGSSIELVLKGTNKTKGLKKWQDYFKSNQKRMQYSFFKSKDIPCGNGSVESAIRRVINLRLKSPGSFWLKDGAERFLFHRSQLIKESDSNYIPFFLQYRYNL